jgi:hypothetical protein
VVTTAAAANEQSSNISQCSLTAKDLMQCQKALLPLAGSKGGRNHKYGGEAFPKA